MDEKGLDVIRRRLMKMDFDSARNKYDDWVMFNMSILSIFN
jgi:hypothetical protein